MTLPVWVEQRNGQFVASVLGASGVAAEGPTSDEAVAALQGQLAARVGAGELRFIDWPLPNGSGNPTIIPPPPWPPSPEEEEYHREFIAEIYRQRDEERRREFGE